MSLSITSPSNPTNSGFLSGFVESNVLKLPDGLNGECTVHYGGGHSSCEMKVRLVNGVRDGEALIVNDGAPYIKLHYERGLLTGILQRMNPYGLVELRGELMNGMECGLFEEYDDNEKVVWRGYYKNGERYSEVVESGELEGYYDEKSISSQSLLTTAQYDDSLHDKNGCCFEYENGSLKSECVYENGVKKHTVREFVDGKMRIFNSDGEKVYEGVYYGDMKSGFSSHEPMEGMAGFFKEVDSNNQLISVSEYDELKVSRNGKCFDMENGKVKRVYMYENGERKRLIIAFNGSTMTEYNESGKRVYEGGFKGDMKNGFVREGKGNEFDENDRVKRVCVYENGMMKQLIQEFNESTMTEYDENGKKVYEGGFIDYSNSWFKRNGSGREFDKDGETIVYSGEWNNGMREGLGTEYYGGHALYVGEWKNGLRNGVGKEMNENGKVVFEGEWTDGKGIGVEYDGNGKEVYEGGWSNGQRNGIGMEVNEKEDESGIVGNWKDGKRNGRFDELDENGVLIRSVLYENDEMKEEDPDDGLLSMLITGKINLSIMELIHNYSLFSYDICTGNTTGIIQVKMKCNCVDWQKNNTNLMAIDLDSRTLMLYTNRMWVDPDGKKGVIDLDANGRRWEGHVKNGIPCGYGVVYDEEGRKEYEGFMLGKTRICFGIEYYSDISRVKYKGGYCYNTRFGKGILYDRNGDIKYIGLWIYDNPYSPHSDGKAIDNHTESVSIPNNSFNKLESFVLPSFILSLKRIVIGDGCFGKTRVFELDGLSELESVVIGEWSFIYAKVDDGVVSERNDGECRIVNCPKLKSIQIGNGSFIDYRSFELNNLPSLESIDIGDKCFGYALSFSLIGLID